MGFSLKVTQQGSEDEELPFDASEVRMGRTADNDVVIKDPSSSRSHARIYEEAGSYLVEDLKSANGTKLNGKTLKQPMPLKNGDRIMIGDVTLEMVLAVAESNDTVMGASSTFDESANEPPAEEEDPNATMLRPPSAPINQPKRPPARKAPEPPPEEEPAEEPEPEALNDDIGGDATGNFNVPPPKSLARNKLNAPAAPARPSRNIAKAEKPEAAPALSAAERARERRELNKSGAGKLKVFWMDLPLPGKIAVGVLGGGAIIALLGFLIVSLIPKKVEKRIEVVELTPNGDPVPESYGLGDVDFERPDMKSFSFSFASPTTIVGVLHYQAQDCSKEEVTIELNGQQLSTIPPDTVDVSQRQLELVLPATQLKLNDPNEIVFDNINNPPGEDTWRVWNVWVEVIPIPQMTSDEAARRAKEYLEKAARMYDTRAVGAMNLFRSWKQYRDAWLLLEATPDRPPELLEIARSRMREIRPELDRKCSGMLVDYQKEVNQKYPDVKKARDVLQAIPMHFEKEHPCFSMARGMLRSLEELSGEPE